MKYIINDNQNRIFQNRFYDFETEDLISPIETSNYAIIQVAQSYYSRGFSIDDHHQLCDLELTFSDLNGLMCSVDGNFENVDKHYLHISFKGERHALNSRKSSRFYTLAINFKSSPCAPMLDAIREKSKMHRTIYIPEIAQSLSDIINEFKQSEADFLLNHLDSLITIVLVKLIRTGRETTTEEIATYDEKLSAMINYINSNFLQLSSLGELASAFGYTYSHLSKIFKKEHGVTPCHYLMSKKADYACRLLESGESLEEIAELLGYSSVFNFSRFFKDRIGVPPTEYKKNIKEPRTNEKSIINTISFNICYFPLWL